MGTERVQNRQKMKKRRFLEKYINIGDITLTAKVTGIDRSTHYKWLEEDPEYQLNFAAADKQALDVLESEAYRRAVKGVNKPIYYKGQRCGYVREYSDTLLIVLMKARAPEKYRERHELSGPGGTPLNNELNIIVKDNETKELLAKAVERTGKSDGNGDNPGVQGNR